MLIVKQYLLNDINTISFDLIPIPIPVNYKTPYKKMIGWKTAYEYLYDNDIIMDEVTKKLIIKLKYFIIIMKLNWLMN